MPGSRDRDWPIPDRQRSIIELLRANPAPKKGTVGGSEPAWWCLLTNDKLI